VVAEAHLLVGEELVVVERVALVDRAQPLMFTGRCMTYFVHEPLEPFVNRNVMGIVSHSSGVTLWMCCR
jgi:hypothetical protein